MQFRAPHSDIRISLTPGRSRLLDAPVRRSFVVVAVDPDARAALASDGLDIGVNVAVERRIALGGPLVLRFGRTRLAISRNVAAQVVVEGPADR